MQTSDDVRLLIAGVQFCARMKAKQGPAAGQLGRLQTVKLASHDYAKVRVG
jgi:hypothetical protein